jgi:hypothetical protein
MANGDLLSYMILADRWINKAPPFNGIAYSRTNVQGIESVAPMVTKIMSALASIGFCDQVVVGNDFFDDSDQFYPSEVVHLNDVPSKLQSPEALDALYGESVGSSYCMLGCDFTWMFQLHGYEPDEASPEVDVRVTLYISREGMRSHDLDSLEFALRQEDDSWNPHAPGEYPGL